MRKLFTIIWIMFFVVCTGIYLYGLGKDKHEKNVYETTSSGNENSQVKLQEEGEQETLSQEGLNVGDYRAVVDEAQLKSMNEWYEVYEPHTGNAYRYQILSAEKSRILRDDFKEKAVDFESEFSFYLEYYGDFLSEEGNFDSDLYYLYVEVEVCNIGKENKMFVMNCFPYLQIDENQVAELISPYSIGDVYFTNGGVYFLVNDGQNVIDDRMTAITPFKENARCRYTICYMITEQMTESNNLYIYKSDGSTGSSVLNNKEIQYVKLDIQ